MKLFRPLLGLLFLALAFSHSVSARYLQSDPIGVTQDYSNPQLQVPLKHMQRTNPRGGVPLLVSPGYLNHLYGYANQNPVRYIDPLGLSSITYNQGTGTIIVHTGGGQTAGTFPAGNNAQSSSNGPFPPGTHTFSWHSPHSGSGPDSQFGSNGNFIFDVPNRTGLGVHSGRANSCDLLGRCGPKHATDGCIRTTDSATQLIRQLHYGGDPPTHITVQ